MSENFETIEARLCAYVEGELDEQGKAEIEKHLQANPHHRRLLDELAAQRALLRRLPRDPAPPELAESFNGQLERAALLRMPTADDALSPAGFDGAPLRISRWPQFAAVAAVVLLAAGLGVMIYLAVPRGARPDYAVVGTDAPTPSTGERGESADRGYAGKSRGGSRSDSESDLALRERAGGSIRALGGGRDAVLGKMADAAPETGASRGTAESDLLTKEVTDQRLDAVQRVETRLAENPDAMVVVVTSRDPRAATGQVAEFLARNDIRWTDATAANEMPLTAALPNVQAAEPVPAQQPPQNRAVPPAPAPDMVAMKRRAEEGSGVVAERQVGRDLSPDAARGPAPGSAAAVAATPSREAPKSAAKAETADAADAPDAPAQRPQAGAQQQQQPELRQQAQTAEQQLYDWAMRNQQTANATVANSARAAAENAIVARMTRQQAQALQVSLANQAGQRAQLYTQVNAYRAAQQQQQQLLQQQVQQQPEQVQQRAKSEYAMAPGASAGRAEADAAKPDDSGNDAARQLLRAREEEFARRRVEREPAAAPPPSAGVTFNAKAAATQPEEIAQAPSPAPARPAARSGQLEQVQGQPPPPADAPRYARSDPSNRAATAPDVRAQVQMRQSIQGAAGAAAAAPIQVGDELVVTLGDASAAGAAVTNAGRPSPQTLRGRVSEDGTIQLPRLDAFACAGLTPAQAAQVIARKYQLADGAAVVPAVNVERVVSTPDVLAANRGMSTAPRGWDDVSGAAAGSGGGLSSNSAAPQPRGGGAYGGAAGAGGGYAEGRAARQQREYVGQQDRGRGGAAGDGYGAQAAPAPAANIRNETAAGIPPAPAAGMNRAAAPATQPAGTPAAGQSAVALQQQQAPTEAPVAQTQEPAAGAAPGADQPVDVLILVTDEGADPAAGAAPDAASAPPAAADAPQPLPASRPAEAK